MAKSFIKKIDLFSLPVNTFYTSRDKKQNKKRYQQYHGSTAGGLLTIVFIMVLVVNIIPLVFKMLSRELDEVISRVVQNDMSNAETSKVNIYKSNFMASVAIDAKNKEKIINYDIFQDNNNKHQFDF